MSRINYEALARALMSATLTEKNLPATAPNQGLAHGPNGLFITPANPKVFNAAILPQLGIMAKLPVRTTVYDSATHPVLTSVSAVSGTDPTTICEPGKVPGQMVKAEIVFPFGYYLMSTRTISITDVGLLRNRAEFTDFTLVGDATPQGVDEIAPDVPQPRNFLASELGKMMYETKIGWARNYGKKVITGNPANNGAVIKEFKGLDLLVNTGYLDANTNAAIPAVDALVRPAFGLNITTQSTAGASLVNELTRVFRYLNRKASKNGLAPVRFAIAMSEALFYEVTAIWPCAYQTYRCTAGAAATAFVDAEAQRRMVEDMRNGMYLLIDGKQVEVIVDDSITETAGSGVDPNTGAGNTSSSIYFLPLMVAGSEPAMYVEAFNFNNPMAQELITAMQKNQKVRFTDNGRVLWVFRENGPCFSADMHERSRIILETPWLSARVPGVHYQIGSGLAIADGF